MTEKIITFTDKDGYKYPKTNTDAIKLGNITIDGIDCKDKTLTDLLNELFSNKLVLSFLHISDTHGRIKTIEESEKLLQSDKSLKFMMHTGDIAPVDSATSKILLNNPNMYVMLGNHCVHDYAKNSLQTARLMYIEPYMPERANMGDDTGVASYWYKDIRQGQNVLRLVSFDEFEYDTVGLGKNQSMEVVYSKKQMDWFINLLLNTPSNYYLILAHHYPVSLHRNPEVKGKFISLNVTDRYGFIGDSDPEMIPKIMEAYLTKLNFSQDFNCGDVNNTMMHLEADFSTINPCTFVCHLCGHSHADICDTVEHYPKQLMLVVDCGKPDKNYLSDLNREVGTESEYCINRVDIDFSSKTIKLTRFGAKVTDDGTIRDTITFNFDRNTIQ